MAKLMFFFIAAFLLVQVSMISGFRLKRDAPEVPETSTANLLDMVKTGFENTFSEKNIQDGIAKLSDFSDKLKDFGTKTVESIQKALNTDATTTPAP